MVTSGIVPVCFHAVSDDRVLFQKVSSLGSYTYQAITVQFLYSLYDGQLQLYL